MQSLWKLWIVLQFKWGKGRLDLQPVRHGVMYHSPLTWFGWAGLELRAVGHTCARLLWDSESGLSLGTVHMPSN